MKKKISHILLGKEKHITKEETVLQPLPHKDFRFANPFIVLHHIRPETISAGAAFRIHPHPHRGFSPVTFMLQGEGYHKDSAGNDKLIRAGGVQWMFAGKGILHSEGPSKEMLQKGGTQEFIQIWVNVPKENKWDEPFYQAASKEEQPKVLQQEGVEFRLASGDFDGQTGPLKSHSPLIAITGKMQKGSRVQVSATSGYWTLLYISKGLANVNGETITMHHLIVFEKDQEEILIIAEEDTELLFLSAEPIDEPVAAKDNFVMNTVEEVDQAIRDYKDGVFGSLNY